MITTQFPLLTEYPGDMPDKINMTAKEYAVAVFALFDWYTKVYLPEENTRRETYDAMTTEMNLLYEVVMNQAVDGGYSQSELNSMFITKVDVGTVSAILSTNISVYVGPTGDYTTITKALEYLTKKYYATYKLNGINVTIYLNADFIMTEQIIVDSLDLGWIEIRALSAETIIDNSSFTPIAFAGYSAFCAINNATLPVIGQLFVMIGSKTDCNGVTVLLNSSGKISYGAGVKNCTGKGLYVLNTSKVEAYGTIFTGSIDSGIIADKSSTINARQSEVSGGIFACIRAIENSNINFGFGVVNSQSTLYAVRAEKGSTINAVSSNCVADTYEYSVDSGSIISLMYLAGQSRTNIAVNTLNGSGIIYSK